MGRVCGKSSWGHPGTRGGRGLVANVRLAYSSSATIWERYLTSKGVLFFFWFKEK